MHKEFKHIITILIIILIFINIYFSKTVQEYDYKIYDLIAQILELSFTTKKTNSSSNVVIINIDKRSIDEIEQWPWSRVIHGQLIANINEMNPATIAFNIYFGHNDKASPIVMKNFYERYFRIDKIIYNIPKELLNNDKFLAQKLSESNSVLSIFMNKAKRETAPHCNELSYNIIDINEITDIPHAYSIECNTKELHQNNPHFGFSALPIDSDGIVREIPLLKRYNKKTFPSFGLATILSLGIHNYKKKKQRVNIFDKYIYLNRGDKLLLPYNSVKPKVFSAIDILKRKIPQKALYGKIVIIGSTVDSLLNRSYKSYGGEKKYSSIIQANYIESLLNHSFLVQNEFYKKLNTVIAFFILILLYILFIKQRFKSIIIITTITLISTTIWLILNFEEGVYISIGYLWVPLLISSILLLIAIPFSKNRREREQLKKDLKQAFMSNASSMVLVANTHDAETGEHIIRTKKYVKILAKQLYLKNLYSNFITPHTIELIYEAAPLHDIGKVGISDAILKKPGKFTPEEYSEMKKHSRLGADIIKESLENYESNPLLELAYNVALYHHERWDGKGYPQQLRGDEIPIEAQLMSIADVYDALISKRRYKDSFTYEKAESIIISERGKAFNPILVDIFIEQKEKFKQISMEWHEEEMV
ncbi:Response regulator [hydrothermal vent metagenome]|uniref:Response regulator n=1 Tax=hydrothermal vent metagenome TaxID=652676 RepID=A0A1W1CA01_9ZZZZ